MITIEKSLRHMAWSNQLFFDDISKLPSDIYGHRVSESEWPVGKVLTHIIGAAEWYRYCLFGIKWTDFQRIDSHERLLELKKYLAELDQLFIEESLKSDREVSYKDEDGETKALVSTILSQVVNHTAEHKGQISTILASKGVSFSLDHLDVWAFAKSK